jgi:transposase InsO family protein
MPWPTRSIVSVRQEFVLKVLAGEQTVADLCRQFGISRETGYKWLRRYRESGLSGLIDQSRRPRSNARQTSNDVVLEVIRLRQAHPSWGPRKLWVVLSRTYSAKELPTPETLARILKRAGLVKRRRYRPVSRGAIPRAPRYSVEGPNDLWTVDFKGWWRTGDGRRCEPLTVRDAFSRYVLAVRLLPSTRERHVREVFERLFDEYGLPKAIQSDNGPPFASMRGLAGLTKLSAWWVSLGIEHVRGRPGCPQDNGGHERMHADMRIEIECDAAENRAAQQRVCDDWRTTFNHVRPHEALDMKTPGELYHPSPRRPGRIILGGHPDGCEIVDVRYGAVRFGRYHIYVSLALSGYPVGLQRISPREVRVWFFDLLLGHFAPGEDLSVMPFLPRPDEDDAAREADRNEEPASSPAKRDARAQRSA